MYGEFLILLLKGYEELFNTLFYIGVPLVFSAGVGVGWLIWG